MNSFRGRLTLKKPQNQNSTGSAHKRIKFYTPWIDLRGRKKYLSYNLWGHKYFLKIGRPLPFKMPFS
jgi:hypothetical protein